MNYLKLFFLCLFFSTAARADFPDDFSNVIWLNTDISRWAETSELTVSFNGEDIIMDHTKARVWPGKPVWSCNCNGNAWVFIERGDIWYAATFEWLRYSQTVKKGGAVNGSHVKQAPLNGSWKPDIGETVGIMVSGLARMPQFRNVSERSNPVLVEWPKDFTQITGEGGEAGDWSDYVPPVMPETPVIVENESCDMLICLMGNIQGADDVKDCYKAVKKFTSIREYDTTGFSPSHTIKKRRDVLEQCEGADDKDIAEIIARFGLVFTL